MWSSSRDVSVRIQFWSVVAILLVAHVQTFIVCHSEWATRQNFVTIGLALIYTAGCVAGQRWRLATPAARLVYFGAQGVIAGALLLLSPIKGPPVYFLLPLVSQAIFTLPLAAALKVCGGLFLAALAHLALPPGSGFAVPYLPGTAGGFVFTAGFSYLVVREASARQRAEAANALLVRHAAEVEELSATRERNRIAREIHDGLGHYLTAIAVQAEAAEALAGTAPQRAAERIGRVIGLTRNALADVRQSLDTLRGEDTTVPLGPQLRALIDAVPDLTVALEIRGPERALPLTTAHALRRIVQEALTNVRKHAGVDSARVTVDFTDASRLSVSIHDDGRGLSSHGRAGLGLNGVRERLESIGGTLHIASDEARGVTLRAEVPL
jgi:signal transduction histidine kinase